MELLTNYPQTPNLAHYSSYPESALVPTANLMLNFVLKPVRHEHFYKKYASKKFLKVRVHFEAPEIVLNLFPGQCFRPRVGVGTVG